MCRLGTAEASADEGAAKASVDRDAARFHGLQPLEKNAGQHQPALPGLVGHCAARGRQLLARPAAKKSLIRVHLPLHALVISPESSTGIYSKLSTGRVRFGDGTNSHSAPPRQRTPRSVAVPPSARVETRRDNSVPRGSNSPSVASFRIARETIRRTISAGASDGR